jgi:hypothetical protein
VTDTFDSLPSDLAAAHALILAERAARRKSEARAARAEADLSHAHATASSADALSSFHAVDKFLPVLIVLNARSDQISAHFNRTEKKSQHRRICCGLVSAVTEQLEETEKRQRRRAAEVASSRRHQALPDQTGPKPRPRVSVAQAK